MSRRPGDARTSKRHRTRGESNNGFGPSIHDDVDDAVLTFDQINNDGPRLESTSKLITKRDNAMAVFGSLHSIELTITDHTPTLWDDASKITC